MTGDRIETGSPSQNALRGKTAYMKKIRLLWLACLLALVPMNPAWSFDGGGDNGGGDEGGSDDGGEDPDEGETHNGADTHDGQDHHGSGHHQNHWTGHSHHDGWGPGPGLGLLGFGPGFGGFGATGFMQPFYPFPYYAYPSAMARPAPPVYLQQQNAGQPAPDSQTGFWHYCRAPEGYYPEVKDCPDGWQQVAPQPAPQPPPEVIPEATPRLPQDNQG